MYIDFILFFKNKKITRIDIKGKNTIEDKNIEPNSGANAKE